METRNHIVQFEIIMEKMYEIEVSDWGYGGTKRVIIRILCVHEFLKIIVVVFGNNKDRLKTDRKLNTIL